MHSGALTNSTNRVPHGKAKIDPLETLTAPSAKIVGATMMTPLGERVGLLWGRAAAGHQGSRQRQRWCRCGAGVWQGLVACVGGAVWGVWRAGGTCASRLAVERVALAVV